MTGYPVIMNGDHAEFEQQNSDTPPKERPDWPMSSFDARDWAEAFAKRFPDVPAEDVLPWFAGALMRGFDERAARQPDLATIRGAVARGWCADENAHKEMDSTLAEAIALEVLALSD